MQWLNEDDGNEYLLYRDGQTYVVQPRNSNESEWFETLAKAEFYLDNPTSCQQLKQLAQQYKQVIKQEAFDNLIRDGGEALVTFERERFSALWRAEIKGSAILDQVVEAQYFDYFCDQLGDDSFLAIDETEDNSGVTIIVAYDALYDSDVNAELKAIAQAIEQQQLSLAQAVAWLKYYQSYHCYGMPVEIFTILQAPKIVNQCLQTIAAADEAAVVHHQANDCSIPIQAIYAYLHREAEVEMSEEYQAFFDWLQGLIWEWDDETEYHYLFKCTQQLRTKVASLRK